MEGTDKTEMRGGACLLAGCVPGMGSLLALSPVMLRTTLQRKCSAPFHLKQVEA